MIKKILEKILYFFSFFGDAMIQRPEKTYYYGKECENETR